MSNDSLILFFPCKNFITIIMSYEFNIFLFQVNNNPFFPFYQFYKLNPGKKIGEKEDIGNGFIVPKDWEHEHCSLCWKAISELEPDDHYGYVNNYGWICQECYDKYIKSGFGKKLGDVD